MTGRILVVAVLGSWLAGFAPAQEEQEAPEKKEVEEALNELETAIKGKVSNDQVHFVKLLAQKWKHADKVQRKNGFKLVKANLKSKEREVREATLVALGDMGGGDKDKDADNSVKILTGETKNKQVEEDLAIFSVCLQSIGRLKTEKGSEALTKFLHHKDNEVIAGALSGLTHYRDAEFPVRKDIVDEVLKIYSSAAGAARNPNNRVAVKKYEMIANPSEQVLKSLTRKTDVEPGAHNWVNWWNNEGKKAKEW